MTEIYDAILGSRKPLKVTPEDIEDLRAAGLDVETDPYTGETVIRDVGENTITFIDKNGQVTKD